MQRNSQFMERLFTLIMTGAYGLVMVWLFVSNYFGMNMGERSLLSLVTTWIQYVIFIGGIILIVLFFFLLFNFKRAGDGHHHTHEHDENHDCCDHGHDHGHDHNHDHNHAGHEHHHHKHAEGHECCDHDHDHNWNPIRYIPLLIPLILIVMGLPDTKMIENFEKYRIESAMKEQKRPPASNEQMSWLILGAFTVPGEVFPYVSFSTTISSGLMSMIDEVDGEARNEAPVVLDLSHIEKALKDPMLQLQYASYGRVEIEGMFNLEESGPVSLFRIVRLRMACCLTDARPAMLLCFTKKKIPEQLLEKAKGTTTRWVKVQGRLKFAQGEDGKYHAILRASLIEPAKVPPFPYLN